MITRSKTKIYGFTLLELLVVIAIIGLLATIITSTVASSRRKARDAKRLNDIQQFRTGLNLFFTHGSGYPTIADWNNAAITNTILYCDTLPIIMPVQDVIYPYVYTAFDDDVDGCNTVLKRDYTLQFTLESTGITYTIDSDGKYSPSVPQL